jgi:hypothetical protein
MSCIQLAQDRVQWRYLVNTVLKFVVPKRAENFFTCWSSNLKKDVLNWVNYTDIFTRLIEISFLRPGNWSLRRYFKPPQLELFILIWCKYLWFWIGTVFTRNFKIQQAAMLQPQKIHMYYIILYYIIYYKCRIILCRVTHLSLRCPPCMELMLFNHKRYLYCKSDLRFNLVRCMATVNPYSIHYDEPRSE